MIISFVIVCKYSTEFLICKCFCKYFFVVGCIFFGKSIFMFTFAMATA